ncbi:ComEC/Rec2 family competence protein [Jatrophihabitans lederbergiae]|uniref:ComEC/Rec2 family competence protein n=1 Tax=Jatrophihabitans lederbergiae TaxID=3075547 RepID=A0ABU2J5W6_9ACTN|nr:ComEC/Rec2 family competence protein [Jatrophihabitans sp. DSM 44399]MDT0260386.1 ComEC/Rec2 family competence protein [Jatrophihabitans sp. DSM 44399]
MSHHQLDVRKLTNRRVKEPDGEREPVDLRLAVGAMAAWAAVIWGLGRSASTAAIGAAVAVVLTVLLLGTGRRCPRLLPVAFAACCVVLVLPPLSARLHRARDGELARMARSRVQVTAELRVTGDPRPLAAHGTSGSPRSAIDAKLLAVVVAGHRTTVAGSVLVLGPSDAWRGILPGQRVRLDATLQPPLKDNLLTATLSARTDPELLGRPPWWQRAAGEVRSGLQRASAGLPVLARGLLPGLVDGDTSQLDPVLANRFRVAGLTHLTAVSGTNCSILIGAVALVLRRMKASPRTIAVLGGVVLVGFVVIARPSPSVLRAALMAAIALTALASGRQRGAVPVLAASVLGLLLWQPSLAVDLGFTLSVAATAALMLIAPGWADALARRGVPTGLAEPLAVAAAAHLTTVPIIAGISGRISLVAIPANLLAEPVVAAATVLGVLAAVTSVLCLPLGALLAQLAGWPCRWLVWVAEYFGSLPGASLPWPSGVPGGLLLMALSVGTALACRHSGVRVLFAVGVAVGVLVQIPGRAVVVAWPPHGWVIVACDIGQGDALVLNAGGGSAVVVDAGPDPVAVDRCLHELGVTRVPLLVLSHSHLDHVGGLSGVLHEREVGRVLTSPLSEPVTGHRLVLNVLATRGLRLEQVSAGATLDAGGVHLDVLGPRQLFHGTRSDPNNSSVVMRAAIGGTRVLLPGDAELEAQDDLLASGVDLRADILKVPHHGSAYSDPAFLQAVHARLALVSVGLGNDYGHPSPLLIAELARLGVPTRRTDQDGDIAVVRDGSRLVPVVHSTRTGNARGPPSSGRAHCLWPHQA